MRKRELEKFKKLLILERQGIHNHLSKLAGDSKNQLDQGGGDSVDIASMEINQAAIQKLGNREKKLLNKIDICLKKIDEGEYGTCENCGEKISAARLEARPVAEFCIDCKTELEQNERRYSDLSDDSSDSISDDLDD